MITPEMLLMAISDSGEVDDSCCWPIAGDMRSVRMDGDFDLVKAAALLNAKAERLHALESRSRFVASAFKRSYERRWHSHWVVPIRDVSAKKRT